MPEQIGLIGLGNLGSPIAANLLVAGFGLKVFNRTRDKARRGRAGAVLVNAPNEVATRGGIVVSVVADDAPRRRRGRPPRPGPRSRRAAHDR